ncbi:MAG: TatD family hydrolase [Lachnospiraceae bacterium]|nr:TatD family hydrolase [Lachnospiraceae bacterium]
MRIFDTHSHYDDEAFDDDRDALLGGLLAAEGVEYVVNMGASIEGAEASADLAEKYAGSIAHSDSGNEPARTGVYAGCGIHPDDTGVFEGKETSSGMRFACADEVMQRLRDLCQSERCVCVGEIGLDYHWMVEQKEVQQRWFREQMRLAYELRLPINVHSRDAAQDTFDLIRENYEEGRYTGGIIHCYSGSLELAREYVKMGYHIGIGGVVTFKNAKVLKRVVTELPPEYLVTETDCPYLSPEPNRGKRNDSRNIRYVIEAIARLKEMDPEECAEILFENARKVYGV